MPDTYFDSVEANVNRGKTGGSGARPQSIPYFPQMLVHTNGIYRGNNLGSSVTEEQWNAISIRNIERPVYR